MIRHSFVLSAFLLLVLSSSAEDERSVGSASRLPSCQEMTPFTYDKYHEHDKCNHAWQTSEGRRVERSDRHKYMATSGSYPLIPRQRTVVCPIEPEDMSSKSSSSSSSNDNGGSTTIGMDTRWVIENKSSGKVVVAYVDNNGVEYSAMNGKTTPPQADPHAILQPGEYKVVNTYEGHVFHVREVMEDGSTGDILLQHRPGVVEFTNRFGKDLNCENNEQFQEEDSHEIRQEANPTARPTDDKCLSSPSHEGGLVNEIISSKSSNSEQVVENEQSAGNNDAQTTTIRQPSHCNMIYQGFRNTLPNCPLDVYYAGVEQTSSNGPMKCDETLKFHLGNEALNNAVDTEANLKFEMTFIGHTFVARLASNPDVVIDSFTIQPTEIHDCPRTKQKQKIKTSEQVIEFNGVQHGNANLQNDTVQYIHSLSTVLPANSFVGNVGSS